MGVKVTLRKKPISKGRESLYLDYYPKVTNEEGKLTRREFLGIYVKKKPKNEQERTQNKINLTRANSIRDLRYNSFNKSEVYSELEKEVIAKNETRNKDFIKYFETLAKQRKSSNYDNWISCLNYLKDYTTEEWKFGDVNRESIDSFKQYLLTSKSRKSKKRTLSKSSAQSYFNKVKAALKQAYRDGYLEKDVNAMVPSIKAPNSMREFLTLEELKRVKELDLQPEILKRASMFASLTGLRFGEIQTLTWKKVKYDEDGYYLDLKQPKTQTTLRHQISDDAIYWSGERKKPSDKVFEGLDYSMTQRGTFVRWMKEAGIDKYITFHCFRHTYATILISQGVDLYTVSKMLGHKFISTTQIYAKIMDNTKREAANKMKL